jgi:ceramide glucosyltransferase
MSHALAFAIEIVTTALAVAGMGYFLAAWIAARIYIHVRRASARKLQQKGHAQLSPGVSVLKSLKGLDPEILDAFRSHCRQSYPGEFELLFGVSSLDDPAVAAVDLLMREFPEIPIRLIECPLRLGTNGKVSTLVQLAHHARYEILLINDSDITVSPRYLERVVAAFRFDEAQQAKMPPVGLVTALYRGRAHGSLLRGGMPARLEAMGISTDFMPSVLMARVVERGLHYGLGSTLAVRRDALEAIGGLLPLADQLADDYELGARVAKAGYRVELCADVVETAVPEYGWRGYLDHQLRWLRTVRDARPSGYAGLVFTYGLGWALLNVIASGLSPISFWLLAMSFFLRLTLAMTVGAEVLFDRQVLAYLWLLPVRDVVAMALWAAGFAGNTIVWRGERFVLHNGRLQKQPAANTEP